MADSVIGPLSGPVEVDETYVGGKPRYTGQSKRGRGTNKQPVLAMVEREGRVKTKPVTNVSGKTLKQFIRIDTISVFLRAYEDGTINMNGLKCCIEAWLEEIVAVGVIDGKPAVYVKKD